MEARPMIRYDGRYDWKGKRETGGAPISWWPSAYHLTIIDFTHQYDGAVMMKPVVNILTNTGRGSSAINIFQNLARHIAKDFGLTLERCLWITGETGEMDSLRVVLFKPATIIGGKTLYRIRFRDLLEGEKRLIAPYL
jgi:hypothetical protein